MIRKAFLALSLLASTQAFAQHQDVEVIEGGATADIRVRCACGYDESVGWFVSYRKYLLDDGKEYVLESQVINFPDDRSCDWYAKKGDLCKK